MAAGVWSQRGAAANPQRLNRYSYVLNNPMRNTDPSGHCPWCPALIAATASAAVGAGVDFGVQMYLNNGDVSKTNWVEVGVSAVVGAASGGSGVAITSAARSVGLAAVTNGGMSAAISGAGAMVQNALQDPQFAPVDPIRAMAISGPLGALGTVAKPIAQSVSKFGDDILAQTLERGVNLATYQQLGKVVAYGANNRVRGMLVGVFDAIGFVGSNASPAVDSAVPKP